MKLVFICPEMNGNGGTETVVKAVAGHFAEKYPVVLTLTSVPENKAWLKSINPKVQLKMPKKNGAVNKIINIFKTLVPLSNDDKVIVLGANLVKDVYYCRKLLHKRWMIISWIHYSLTHQNLFEPHNILFADKHWAISSTIKQQLVKMGTSSKNISLIFNPVPKYNGPLNRPSKKGLNFVYVGRTLFDGQKNLHEMLDAVSLLAESNNNVHLTLYGTGPDEERCKEYCSKKNITEFVTWRGWVSDPWSEIIDQIHPMALLLTSKYEGLPMVMLEAMSRGIPCICSNFAGYKDVQIEGINGYSYQLGNTKDLVTKLQRCLDRDFSPSMVSNSISRFYSKNYFQKLDQLVNKL